ncbi:MAG TPA: glutamyl-tRNA reductase [candidate division Zixibacteria bacterium]|nr:glutamyl-tRNA reductase [candidate division Zixibacteria bacterium]
MDKQVIIVGLNHRSAPIAVRESVAFDGTEMRRGLRELRAAAAAVEESVILSTCNRVEVVAAAADAESAGRELREFLAEHRDREADEPLEQHLYEYRGPDAARHLFRVASSLDSMVVGEPQILGQLKEAYRVARESGTVGTVLHRLFHRCFFVAKRVRTETAIASRAVSISSVAVDLAKRIFDRFDDKTVMLIGAGKMGRLMALHLQRHGVKSLMVTNRTFEGAVDLASHIHGSPIRFEDFPQYLKLADLVIGCAGAPAVLVDAPMVEKVLRERKQQAMFFIDIGDRRNFDPRINGIDNVYLYNIDDLKAVAEENLQERSAEAEKAEQIVQEEVESFDRWLRSLERAPTIAALHHKFEQIRCRELEKSLSGALRELSDRERQALDRMTSAMIKKMLHGPISRLKAGRQDDEDLLYVAALRRLFDLDPKE